MKGLFLSLLLLILSTSTLAQESLKDILTNPSQYDGREVVVKGEVIGAVLSSKGGKWVNISEDGVNIGLFIENERLLEYIHWFGSYKKRGDIIVVRGIFHQNCPQHYERDIHVKTLEVIQPGKRLEENIPLKKWIIFVILTIINLILVWRYLAKQRKWRRLKS